MMFPKRLLLPLAFFCVTCPLVALAGVAGSAPGAEASPEETAETWRFVARFHLVLLHFPIGLLGLVGILEVYGLFRPSLTLLKITGLILLIGSISALMVSVMGLMLASEGGYNAETLSQHKWLGLGVVAMAIVTTYVQRSATRQQRWTLRWSYRGLLGITLALLMLAGHHGGNLTHGSQYLVKYAPGFVKQLMADSPPEGGDKASSRLTADGEPSAEAREYHDLVLPILETSCYRCHGPEKEKGSYRLDNREIALAGGDSELPAIVPGDPMQSNLMRLLLLPSDHEDVMPPKGKEALTAEEIVLIARWIQKGASFGDVEGVEDSEDAVVETEEPASEEAEATTTEPSAEPVVEPTGDADTQGTAAPQEGKQTDAVAPSGAGAIDFETQIRPLLETKCLACHGEKRRKGKLSLYSAELALKGGKQEGPSIVAGQPEESPIYRRLTIPPAEDEDEELMPPEDEGGPLTADEIELVRQWIAEGAQWPATAVLEDKSED